MYRKKEKWNEQSQKPKINGLPSLMIISIGPFTAFPELFSVVYLKNTDKTFLVTLSKRWYKNIVVFHLKMNPSLVLDVTADKIKACCLDYKFAFDLLK